MTSPVDEAPKKAPEIKEKPERKETVWSKQEKESCKEKYGCEVIVDNGTLDDVSIKHVPSDACIVKYLFEDKVRFDLTRGTKMSIFDMYYDRFKKDALHSISYGNGTIKPNLWGYQQAPPKKKKRKA